MVATGSIEGEEERGDKGGGECYLSCIEGGREWRGRRKGKKKRVVAEAILAMAEEEERRAGRRGRERRRGWQQLR